jgi:hypothetical protein
MMKLDLKTLRGLYQRASFEFPEGLNAFCLRGVKVGLDAELTPNDEGFCLWNDVWGLADPDRGVLYAEMATGGQPAKYWSSHRIYRGLDHGAPFTLPCRVTLHRGKHRRQWPCLRVSGQTPYPVILDVDQDYTLTDRDRCTFACDQAGINIHFVHSVGDTDASGGHVINRLWGSASFKKFHRLIWGEYARQQTIPYAVFESEWLTDRIERVLYGSTGMYVKQLQERLNEAGLPVRVDGEFGPITHQRVLDWGPRKSEEVARRGIVSVGLL